MEPLTASQIKHFALQLKPSELKAARWLLGWTAQEFADNAKVHITSVQQVERGSRRHGKIAMQMVKTLNTHGVCFMEGDKYIWIRGPEDHSVRVP